MNDSDFKYGKHKMPKRRLTSTIKAYSYSSDYTIYLTFHLSLLVSKFCVQWNVDYPKRQLSTSECCTIQLLSLKENQRPFSEKKRWYAIGYRDKISDKFQQ
ncbi:hypothetical protein ACOME3_002971 [Neoechinorhynchus agilis]